MKKTASIRMYALAGLFTALIFLATAYLFHIPTPATGGYIHLGDAFLYLAASLLPLPYAVFAGGVGEALSDLLTGGAAFALPTFLIKSAMALCFSAAGGKIISRRNLVASAAAGLVCVAGYFLTEALMFHNFTAPLGEVPANLVQAAGSAAAYLLIGKAFDRAGVKNRMARSIR